VQETVSAWLAKIGSLFHKQGAAYRKERLVIFQEDRLGGRARVTIDFCCDKVEQKSSREDIEVRFL